MSLHGPSKTIVVEPIERPAQRPVPAPAPRPAAPTRKEPAPAR
jgi:hypothetical protein